MFSSVLSTIVLSVNSTEFHSVYTFSASFLITLKYLQDKVCHCEWSFPDYLDSFPKVVFKKGSTPIPLNSEQDLHFPLKMGYLTS
jgi:hypothetical protein